MLVMAGVLHSLAVHMHAGVRGLSKPYVHVLAGLS